MSSEVCDIPLVLEQCDGDWFVIRKAGEHGDAHTRQTGPMSFALIVPSRITDADVEGTAAEMRQIALAIRLGQSTGFRRVAVDPVAGGFEFYSPRNSTYDEAVTVANAMDLARQIDVMCGVEEEKLERSPVEWAD